MKFHTICAALLFALTVLNAGPAVAEGSRVLWEEGQRETVSIVSPVRSDEVQDCIQTGLELEHRFLLKFCEKVNRIGTRCGEVERVIHNLSFDPIQDSYRVVKDTLGDAIDPQVSTHWDFQESLDDTAQVDALKLSTLIQEDDQAIRFSNNQGIWNLGVRVRTRCKGEYPKFLADVSYYLSFGILDFYGDDTGWEYFRLDFEGAPQEEEHSPKDQ